jgi:hypothetical protein
LSEEKPKISHLSSYKEEYPQKLIDFFNREHFQEIGGKTYPNFLPTVEGFCNLIGVTRTTYHLWRKTHPDFNEAHERSKSFQQEMLVNLSLLGFYKEGFAKFLAYNTTNLKSEAQIVKEQTSHLEDAPPITLNYNLEGNTTEVKALPESTEE